MPTNRRVLLQGTAATLVFAPAVMRVTRVGAAEYTFKMANNSPESHPLTIRMREAAANILKDVAGSKTSELPDGLPHEVVHRDDLVMLP